MTLADLLPTDYGTAEGDRWDDLATSPDAPVEEGRILVVDDDPTAVTLMRHMIEREGFTRVVTASDGRQALDLIREQPPDVVVLDVHLPELDGLEVLREIVRSDERTGRPTGVLGVSGDVTNATAQSMLWAGADDFIPRPFTSAEFTLRVRRLASRTRSLRRALAYSRFLERRTGFA
jgi:DNA-binding response OmpR family regulator